MRGIGSFEPWRTGPKSPPARIACAAISAAILVAFAAGPSFAEDREAAKAIEKVEGSVTAWKKKKERCSATLRAGNQRVANIHDSDKPEDQATVKAERKKGLGCVNEVLKEGDRIAEEMEAALQKAVEADQDGNLGDQTRRTALFVRGTFVEEFTEDIFAGDLDGYLLIGSLSNGSIDGAYLPRNFDNDHMMDLPIGRN